VSKALVRRARLSRGLTGGALVLTLAVFTTAAAMASPPAGASSSPKSIISSFYRAVSAWNFGNAYSYIDPKGRPGPFHTWALNHTDTSRVVVNSMHDPGYRIYRAGSSYTCVGVRFTSYQTNGSVTPYGGWYMTHLHPAAPLAHIPHGQQHHLQWSEELAREGDLRQAHLGNVLASRTKACFHPHSVFAPNETFMIIGPTCLLPEVGEAPPAPAAASCLIGPAPAYDRARGRRPPLLQTLASGRDRRTSPAA